MADDRKPAAPSKVPVKHKLDLLFGSFEHFSERVSNPNSTSKIGVVVQPPTPTVTLPSRSNHGAPFSDFTIPSTSYSVESANLRPTTKQCLETMQSIVDGAPLAPPSQITRSEASPSSSKDAKAQKRKLQAEESNPSDSKRLMRNPLLDDLGEESRPPTNGTTSPVSSSISSKSRHDGVQRASPATSLSSSASSPASRASHDALTPSPPDANMILNWLSHVSPMLSPIETRPSVWIANMQVKQEREKEEKERREMNGESKEFKETNHAQSSSSLKGTLDLSRLSPRKLDDLTRLSRHHHKEPLKEKESRKDEPEKKKLVLKLNIEPKKDAASSPGSVNSDRKSEKHHKEKPREKNEDKDRKEEGKKERRREDKSKEKREKVEEERPDSSHSTHKDRAFGKPSVVAPKVEKEREKEVEKTKESKEFVASSSVSFAPNSSTTSTGSAKPNHCLSELFVPSVLEEVEKPPPGTENQVTFYQEKAKKEKKAADQESDKFLKVLGYFEAGAVFTMAVAVDTEQRRAGYAVLSDVSVMIKDVTNVFLRNPETAASSTAPTPPPGKLSHYSTRLRQLSMRTQAVLAFHLFQFRAAQTYRSAQHLSQWESTSGPEEIKDVSGNTPRGTTGTTGTTPSPSSSNHSVEAQSKHSMVAIPTTIYQEQKSQLKQLGHLMWAHRIWKDARDALREIDTQFVEALDKAPLPGQPQSGPMAMISSRSGPLHLDAPLERMSAYLLTGARMLKAEYEAERKALKRL